MRADPYPLKQLLSLERRYVIPTFQRDYEWTEDGQWELLADDLEAVAQRLSERRRIAQVTGAGTGAVDRDVSPHFLGAIVLDQLAPTRAGGLDVKSVIDGQQRLTTLELLVRGLLDVATEFESTRGRQLRRLLRNPDDIADGDEIHKLWPRRRDRTVWVQAMADDPDPDAGDHRYLQARRYFAERARSASEESEDPTGTLDDLVDAFLDLFRIVVIDLDDNDDAQVIFEVLNGRQTPLTAADLVKNLLFLRAEQQGTADVEDLYDAHWARFDDEWWKETIGRGHAARRHHDLMLASWLTVASGVAAHPDRLYGQVRRHLDETAAKISHVLEEIGAYAGHYRAYLGVEDEPDIRVARAYERMRRLGANTALPVIMWARERRARGLMSDDAHRRAVLATESFLVRRVIVGANTRGYNQLFRELLAVMADSEGSADEALMAALLDLDGTLRWPTDEEVRTAFVDRQFYDNVAQYVTHLLLASIEDGMRAAERFTERVEVAYDKLTIEHLMPRSWREHWPIEGEGAERVVAEQERDAVVHRIGNLTLINGSFNSSQSNRPWTEKRRELAKHSSLRMNNQIVNRDDWADWNEEAIRQRGRELAATACRVWERPST